MKEKFGLFLILFGILPVLLLEKLNGGKSISETTMLFVCPLLSIGMVGGLCYLLGGLLYSAIGLVILFAIGFLIYWKGFA